MKQMNDLLKGEVDLGSTEANKILNFGLSIKQTEAKEEDEEEMGETFFNNQ